MEGQVFYHDNQYEYYNSKHLFVCVHLWTLAWCTELFGSTGQVTLNAR